MKWKCPVRPCKHESTTTKSWEDLDLKEKIAWRVTQEKHLMTRHSISQIVYELYILSMETQKGRQ